MKNFLGSIVGTIVGMAIFSVISLIIMIAAVAVLSSDETESISSNSVLKIKLQGQIADRSQEGLMSVLGDDSDNIMGLDDFRKAISAAADDESIKGILLECGAFTTGHSTLREIREELKAFKEKGKFVYAYSGAYTQGGYYLCSVADSIFLNPQGVIDFRGLSYSTEFYKELLSKIGVEMQVVKVGTFKSYTEQYTNTQMSDSSRLQATELIDDLWHTMLNEIGNSRGLTEKELQASADSFMTFRTADFALKNRLVDAIAYGDEVSKTIAKKTGADKDKPNYIGIASYVKSLVPSTDSKEIAVVYAEGEIDNGNNDGINTKKLSAQLLELKADSSTKAVVLRVNSPGGSAYGSEQVWHAVNELKKSKPVVVSMGDYAASGGYYISAAANVIVANPNTMTGSIGIFGVIPNAEELAEKIGIDYDAVSTNKYSDFPCMWRKMESAELALVQKYVDNGYDVFLDRCANGRKLSKQQVGKVAEGRVWSGTAALKRQLVDTLGTLNTAIEIAANMAGLEEYGIGEYPEKESILDRLSHSPSLGVRALKSRQMFQAEKDAIEKLKHIDMLQAALPCKIEIK